MGAAQKQTYLPFARPDIGQEEIDEVVDTLRAGWLTMGPKTAKFEQEFAACVGAGVSAIAVSSATAGLHLALEAVGIRDGDEVLTTPYTFTATAEVIRYLGARPVFVDVEPQTLCIDPRRIEAAIGPRTRAIIPVHLGGIACDMTSILQIARRRNLRVIEDAAHAFPTTHAGRLIGSLESDATVFSFYATKTLVTGEGGMVVTRDAAIARRCRTMRLHGIDRAPFDRTSSAEPHWRYEVIAPGFKYNMTDIAAAIGLQQLKKVRRFQQRRAEIAAAYDHGFRDLPVTLPAVPPMGDLHAWHLYVLRLNPDAPLSRDAFIERMEQLGIGTSVHFIPLHVHPYWRDAFGLRPEDFPVAYQEHLRAVSLPIYSRMADADVARVIDAVRGLLA